LVSAQLKNLYEVLFYYLTEKGFYYRYIFAEGLNRFTDFDKKIENYQKELRKYANDNNISRAFAFTPHINKIKRILSLAEVPLDVNNPDAQEEFYEII
jgi:hypothetical protein